MLRWSRRSLQRTTSAAARCTISSRCSRVAVIPNNTAFPKSSVEVTSACASVLHALNGRDDHSYTRYIAQSTVCSTAYTSDVYGHRHCRVKIHAKVTDVGRRPDVTSTLCRFEEEMVVPYDSVLQTVSLLSSPRLIAGIVTPTTLSRQ